MSAAALSANDSLVVIGDVESFCAPLTITHDREFVQVTIAPHFAPSATYVRAIRQREASANAWQYSALIARQVEEVAALVSSPSLVAWLLDCGFVRNP